MNPIAACQRLRKAVLLTCTVCPGIASAQEVVAHHRSRRCSPVPGGEIDIEKVIAFDEYGDIIIDRDPNGGRSKAVANHVKVQRGSIP
jgi:hypothetical protein